jgi:Cof subfamily protein (haloacid dehalogenase superfamily)
MRMNTDQTLRLVATDLDGTFLKNDKSISAENIEMLRSLGKKGIQRVIATGRNLKKTNDVIPLAIPFDYIVFSSGAGVYDQKNGKLLYRQNISPDVVQKLSDYLISCDLNFHLFQPVPENHQCWYYRGSVPCDEFENYFDYLQSTSEPLPVGKPIHSEACQFLVIFPNDRGFYQLKEKIEHQFPEIKVVRTSSPLGTDYVWMEIFHHSVSKGNGVKFVCDSLEIDHKQTLGIGNDFNDLDLLEFTNFSYIVENGPEELKSRFLKTSSNEENAFALTVSKYL